MSRGGRDWRYRGWREAELPLLVDDPACVRTTELAVAEADPAVVVAVPSDDVLERLAPKLRRVLRPCVRAGDERGLFRPLEAVLRAAAIHDPWPRFAAAVAPWPMSGHRNAALVYGLLHERIELRAVTLSRERVSQLVCHVLFKWGRTRAPALLRWFDRARQRARRAHDRRAARRWRREYAREAREPAPALAPYILPARMQGAGTWLANAAREEVPNPHEWLRILSSVRPVIGAPVGPRPLPPPWPVVHRLLEGNT